MKDFRFANEHTRSQIADITDLLRKPRLWVPTEQDYPSHGDWLDKAEAQLAAGTKRAMTATLGCEAIGAVIYQRHPEYPSTLEIRNISVMPDQRGRYVGAFLLRNTEIEAVQSDFPGVKELVVDTKTSNLEMIAFLQSQGYRTTVITDLYSQDAGLDVVLKKSIV